jgi:oligoendopeptidase F
MQNLADLPRTWDLTSYFPSLDGPEYREFKIILIRDLGDRLKAITQLSSLNSSNVQTWSEQVNAYEELVARIGHLSSYLGNICAADAANEIGKRESAELSTHYATLTKIRSELLRGAASANENDWQAFLVEPSLQGAAFTLNRMRAEAGHRMSGPEEALAADLGVDGINAWGRLYDNLTGQLNFEMKWPDGRSEMIPMAQRRALMAHTDRAVRAAAFKQGNLVWEAHGETFAAALNAIAGTRHTLYGRRGQPSFLDQPYFDSAVSAATVDAMFKAILANIEVPREALRLGAKLQKTPALAFYDLEAPRPLDPVPPLGWSDAVNLVEKAFDAGYPGLAGYYRDIFNQRWVESEKRVNKRSGAYCTGSVLTGEQRVFMTYADTMHDANTLAHEVGHAWHSHLIKDLRPFAQEYPMTLAETASTFAEKMFMHGMLQDPKITAAQKAFLLDQECSNAGSYLLDIAMRYQFEQVFYTRRQSGELSVNEIKALMVESQRKVYGDTLAEGDEDPWFWASKLHFYITEVSFYNFPYTFGYLLSQALFAEFTRTGPAFITRYEAFLRATGVNSCEEAVKTTLDWDLTSESFWADAVRSVESPVRAFADVVAARD